MKSAPFDYIRPNSIAEASAALIEGGLTAAAIAGGQSLLPMLNLRVAVVDRLVDISRLEELKVVTKNSTGLRIGALVNHAAIEDGSVPDLFGGLMRCVSRRISYRSVRHFGTIGGSVALADPAADWPGCLMLLRAHVLVGGPNDTRSQPIDEFIRGAYSTTLKSGEIILGFDIPQPDAPLHWGFAKVVRKSGAFANSIAFVARRGRDGPYTAVLGAAGPRALVLAQTANTLRAGGLSEEALRATITAELRTVLPGLDGYENRLHCATLLRAVRNMQVQ